MTKRTYFNILLLALIIPINELHHLWKDDLRTVNPWFYRDYPLNIQWYMKFLFMNMADTIKALLLYRAARMNQVLRIATCVYLIITLMDFLLFFMNFNQADYTLVYSFLALVIVMAAYHRRQKHHREINQST